MAHSAMQRRGGAEHRGKWSVERMKQVCRESSGAVKGECEERERQSQLLPLLLLWVLVPWSFTDLRFVSYPCTFPANLPLLIKPGGLGFYYLQLTKTRLKQMRAYFQIIGPKRLEASTQLTYLWKMQRNLHAHSQKDGLFSHEGYSRWKGKSRQQYWVSS